MYWKTNLQHVRLERSETGNGGTSFSISKRVLTLPKTKIWNHFYRPNIPHITGKNHMKITFGHWKVVFSPSAVSKRFFFLIFCTSTSFQKEEGLHHKMHKTKLVWYDVVPNLVVDIEIFNFCLIFFTPYFCIHIALRYPDTYVLKYFSYDFQ